MLINAHALRQLRVRLIGRPTFPTQISDQNVQFYASRVGVVRVGRRGREAVWRDNSL